MRILFEFIAILGFIGGGIKIVNPFYAANIPLESVRFYETHCSPNKLFKKVRQKDIKSRSHILNWSMGHIFIAHSIFYYRGIYFQKEKYPPPENFIKIIKSNFENMLAFKYPYIRPSKSLINNKPRK